MIKRSELLKNLAVSLALGASALTVSAPIAAQETSASSEQGEKTLHFPVKTGGKWGVVNTRGEFVIPAQYDDADVWEDGLVRVRKGGLEGVLRLDGSTVIPMTFRRISSFGDRDFTYANIGGDEVIIDRTGKVILGPGFQSIYSFDGERSFLVRNGRLTGVVTLDCDWLLEPGFVEIRSVSDNGLALAVTSNKEHGFVDAQGKWVIAPEDHDFEDLWDFDKNGLAAAKSAGQWGFINARGEWVIDPFHTGRMPPYFFGDPARARVEVNGKSGLIDLEGNFIVPAEYGFKGGGGGDIHAFTKDGKFGAFDKTGKVIIPFEYDKIGWVMNGDTVKATKDGRDTIFDSTGKVVTKPEYKWSNYDTLRGWRASEKDGKWGAINENGAWVLEPKFECVGSCFRGVVSPPVATMADPLGPRFTSADIDRPREQEWCRVDD